MVIIGCSGENLSRLRQNNPMRATASHLNWAIIIIQIKGAWRYTSYGHLASIGECSP